jgi:hypothetical protein
MRWLLLAATLFGGAGCLGVDSPDGSLRCADTDMYPGRACPAEFYCAGDGRCYRGAAAQPLPGVSKTGCAALLQCDVNCGVQACRDNCLTAASDKALTFWNPAFACALDFCGTATCSGPNDASSTCWTCVQNILRSGLAGTGPCWNQIGPCLAIGNQ